MCYLTVSWCWRQYVYLIKLLFYFVIQRHYYWGQHVPFFSFISWFSNDLCIIQWLFTGGNVCVLSFRYPTVYNTCYILCIVYNLRYPTTLYWRQHVYPCFFYCYPPVYYTGYIYLLSSDCVLAATCVSIFIVTVIQRFSILATIIRYPTTLYWRQYMCPFL